MAGFDLSLDEIAWSDGRQSETAGALQRGTGRLLKSLGMACLTEVALANMRRADMVAVNTRSDLWIIEIKSSLADFQADRKWHHYLDYCDRFYFSVTPEFPREVLPQEAGLILADQYHGEVMREPETQPKLAPARRKAMLIRLAQTGALRLQNIFDPPGGQAMRGARQAN